MEWGKAAENLKKKAKQTGKIPDALQRRPEVPYILRDYFLAYMSLEGRRHYTMGSPLPLQVAEITSYARAFGFESDMRFFYRCMCEMDMEYFEYQSVKRKSEDKAKPAARNGARPPKRRR